MGKFDGFTVADIPDLLGQFRRPRDLGKLCNDIFASGLIREADLKSGKGIAKQLREEVVPLYRFGLAMEDGSIGIAKRIEIRPIIGSQCNDAEFRPANGENNAIEQLQITFAVVDGYQAALGDEYRVEHGRSSPFAGYDRDCGRSVIEASPPSARTRNELEPEIICAARCVIKRKARKRYPSSTWLLCWLDDYFVPGGLSESACQLLSATLDQYSSAFRKIVVMGYETRPIFVG